MNSTPPAAPDSELIAIGWIRRPMGLKGEVGVTPHGATLGSLRIPCQVILQVGEGGPRRPGVIVQRKPTPKGYNCRLEGIDSIEGAETLRGVILLIEERQLPPLPGDRFYHFELKGMSVEGRGGEEVGTVIDVHNYPSTDALEVKRPQGALVMIPLNGGSVVSVDKTRRVVVVDMEMLEDVL